MAQVADNDSRNSICLMAGCTVSYNFAGLADPRSISETCFMNTYCVLAHSVDGAILAHSPGAGPRRRTRVLAGGLRLVTEGYKGVPPLPPP